MVMLSWILALVCIYLLIQTAGNLFFGGDVEAGIKQLIITVILMYVGIGILPPEEKSQLRLTGWIDVVIILGAIGLAYAVLTGQAGAIAAGLGKMGLR